MFESNRSWLSENINTTHWVNNGKKKQNNVVNGGYLVE